jgi:putative transposase
MHLFEGEIYHVFNRGNNRGVIFPRRQNYHYFLQKIEKYLRPCCDILAWCLMPNHFHFLIHANANSIPMVQDGSIDRQQFSQGIKVLLSSYARGINKQEGRTGSLFQQNTKGLCVSAVSRDYALTAFHYVHQNPMRAGLVDCMEDWEFSSFREYLGKGGSCLCNKELAIKLLDLNPDRIYEEAYESCADVSYTCQV